MQETGTSVESTPQTEEQLQVSQKAELDRLMSINLNGGRVPQEQQVLGQPQPTAPATQEVIEEIPAVVEPTFNTLSEKFGWQKPEDAITEIEQLRAFKAAPAATPEYQFENEESKKAFLALSKGDRKEALKIIAQQDLIENLVASDVTKDSAPDIIKLNMQLKYPNLSPAQIDFQYKQDYGIPKEPVYNEAKETEEEFNERHDAWKESSSNIQMKMEIAATMAKPELEAAKTKIVFPEIEQTVDQEYVQWKQLMDKQGKLDAEIQGAYKAITPKAIETKIPFIDEANKIKFEFQYEPDAASLNQTVESATDYDKFLNSFVKSDGTFDKQEYLACIHFAKNRNAILSEAMKQSKNATLKSLLPDNSGGTQRQFPQQGQQLNELDQMMQLNGIRRG